MTRPSPRVREAGGDRPPASKRRPSIKGARHVRHCFAFLHSRTCTNAECKFPHLSEKEIVDRVAAYNAEKAALHVAGPCILLDEESIKFWNIAGVCIDDLSEDWENRTTVVPGGHKGDIIFEIPEADKTKT